MTAGTGFMGWRAPKPITWSSWTKNRRLYGEIELGADLANVAMLSPSLKGFQVDVYLGGIHRLADIAGTASVEPAKAKAQELLNELLLQFFNA